MPPPPDSTEPSLQEMLNDLTWAQITEGGIITIEEIDAALRAKGFDPEEYDHLYD